MIGKYSARLDEKNRLIVPAKLRQELGDVFYVTFGVNCGHSCLTAYTAAEWKTLSDNYNALSISQRAGATSLIFMNATECTPDKQFRFSLTPFLMEYAGISREVMIVDLGRGGIPPLRAGEPHPRKAAGIPGGDRAMSEFHHVSVLLDECIQGLNIRPDGIYVDGTLGGAGHSSHIASKITTGRLIGIDRDEVALTAAAERLAPYGDRVTLVHSNFCDIASVLARLGIGGVDGILLDLGVSSPQLDDGARGFSYMADAPLDMRMDHSEALTAAAVVNTWSYEELKRILYEYGEERYAPQIASAICKRREQAPVRTTLELVDIIRSAMPPAALREKQHPAKRSFQAIRIAVNDELGAVSQVMRDAIPCLNPGGRLAVITFHSLEDRIVKNAMAEAAKGCTCPPSFPVCVCGKKPKVRLITRKPIVSGEEELARNPRARSAKLRICEKL